MKGAVSNVVCLKRKFPSSTSERGDRLNKRNETKFEFISKEEEECGLLCISNEGGKGCARVKISLT